MAAITLGQALLRSADGDAGITYLAGDAAATRISYGDLYLRALRVLAELQKRGLNPGANVVLQLDGNPQLVDAFWACQLGGFVAVPLAVGGTDEHQLKTLNVLSQLDNPTLLSQDRNPERLWEYARRMGSYDRFAATFDRAVDITQMAADGPRGEPFDGRASELAALQYSSGSTGTPKGVMLTHEMLLADIEAIIRRTAMSKADSHLSWVPLTHDLGMVMFHLLPVVLGVEQHLISALRFARRPLCWLQHASETRATILCSPNFGYDHYLKSLAKGGEQQLDLSAVRVIFNGGEPISRRVCDEFSAALAAYGLPSTAIRPAYGLAEACVAATMTHPDTAIESVRVDRDALVVGREVAFLDAPGAGAAEVVCVGEPVDGCEVQILDDQGQALSPPNYGRIFIRGAMVTAGYYDGSINRTDGGWLDTGDLGFIRRGALYVLGRAKDTIIVNGVNYHPSDLERICNEVLGLEVGKVTCCGVARPGGVEQLAVFVTHRQGLDAFASVVQSVRRALGEHTQLDAAYVLPVRQMPKTTSGKIQRYKLAEAFAEGAFDADVDALQRAGEAVSPGQFTPLQKTLYGIFNSVVPDVQLSVNDNFLDVGVSSLSLAEISEAIDAEFPDQLELSDFVEYPSIAELAEFLAAKLGDSV